MQPTSIASLALLRRTLKLEDLSILPLSRSDAKFERHCESVGYCTICNEAQKLSRMTGRSSGHGYYSCGNGCTVYSLINGHDVDAEVLQYDLEEACFVNAGVSDNQDKALEAVRSFIDETFPN